MVRTVAYTLLAAAVYFAVAAGVMAFTRFDGGVAMLWPTCGVLAGFLERLPLRRWPPLLAACGLAVFIATCRFGIGPAAAPFYVPVNLAEPVLIAWGLRHAARRQPELGSIGTFVIFVALAGVAAPALSALWGATVAHAVTGKPWGELALDWFAGHALGNLIVLPVMHGICCLPVWARRARGLAWAGAATLLALVAIVTGAVFWQTSYPLLFLPLLPLMASAFLLGLPGTAAAMLLIATIGGVATMLGTGPLALMDVGAGVRAQFFQLYVATAGLIAFPMAAELGRRKLLVTDLRRSEASYRLLADRMGDVLLRLGVDGTIDYASPSVTTIGGLVADEVVGRSAQALVIAEDRAAVVAAHRAAVADPDRTQVVEYRYRRPDGRLMWLETHTRAYCDEDGGVAGVVSAIRDVTQRKATEHELLWEATTDPLTGIGNRRAFERALARAHEAAMAGGRGGCVAMFDIDHFKRINDGHGHDAGDAVIRALAETLRGSLRQGDFAARLGGEEFALILGGIDEAQAALVCERVRAAFAAAEVRHAGGTILTKTASAGVCGLTRAADGDAVVRLADEALYRAKRGGRDRLELAA